MDPLEKLHHREQIFNDRNNYSLVAQSIFFAIIAGSDIDIFVAILAIITAIITTIFWLVINAKAYKVLGKLKDIADEDIDVGSRVIINKVTGKFIPSVILTLWAVLLLYYLCKGIAFIIFILWKI